MNIKNTLLAMCLCGISMLPLEAQPSMDTGQR